MLSISKNKLILSQNLTVFEITLIIENNWLAEFTKHTLTRSPNLHYGASHMTSQARQKRVSVNVQTSLMLK